LKNFRHIHEPKEPRRGVALLKFSISKRVIFQIESFFTEGNTAGKFSKQKIEKLPALQGLEVLKSKQGKLQVAAKSPRQRTSPCPQCYAKRGRRASSGGQITKNQVPNHTAAKGRTSAP